MLSSMGTGSCTPSNCSSISSRRVPSSCTVLRALADSHLKTLPNKLWIVSEDAAAPNETVRRELDASGVEFVYLAHGPTRQKGHEQRSVAYDYIRRRRLRTAPVDLIHN